MAKVHNFQGPVNLNKFELQNARLQNLFNFPPDPFEGQIIYKSDLKYGAFYTGTKWLFFGVPPLAVVYESAGDMFSDQENQLVGYLYFDGEKSYIYLGGTTETSADYFEFSQMQALIQYRLAYGGVVQWTQTGLDFTISPTGGYLGGPLIEFPAGAETLNPLTSGIPSNKRIDVIFFSASGYGVLEGTPALEPIKPSINPLTQIELTFVLLAEGETEPEGINGEPIYKENAEWTVTSSGTVTLNPASTEQAKAGTLSVKATALQDGAEIRFNKGTTIDLDNFDSLGIWIYPLQLFKNAYKLLVGWYDAGDNLVGSSINYLDTNALINNQWNFIATPLSDFVFATKVVQRMRIRFVRLSGSPNHSGFYLDEILLEGGLTTPSTGSGIPDAPSDGLLYGRRNQAWALAEPAFPKGNLVAGTNVTLTGTTVGRLVGSGDVVINSAGGGGGTGSYIEDLPTWPVLIFDKNYRYVHEMVGPLTISSELLSPLGIVGNFNKIYIKADGVNIPEFTAEFEVVWNSYANVSGSWNRLLAELTPEGKILLQIEQAHLGTPSSGTGAVVIELFFDDNYVIQHVVSGTVELTVNNTGAEIGYKTLLYIQADGVNKPFWSSDIVVTYDDYINEAGVWNRFWIEWRPENKALSHIINL